MRLREGGEIYEMDVSPCNSLLDLWFTAMVLSKTLNGSSEGKGKNKELKGRQFLPAFFILFWETNNFTFARVCNIKS
jgi:hypothetical protein